MPMTPRGWTINALATELERDRRTIAKKLARVRPIEVRGRSKYYRLRDALDALEEKRPAPSNPSPYDQVEMFEINREGPLPIRTSDEIRAMFGVEDTEVRRWLRYGCPFVEVGSPDTTTGWTFRTGHVFRWLALFTSYLEVRGLLPSEAELRGTESQFVPPLGGASF